MVTNDSSTTNSAAQYSIAPFRRLCGLLDADINKFVIS